MLYATSPRYAYRRNNYGVISLAPFVFISVLVILGMWISQGTAWVALLAICGVINASGTVGDMWNHDGYASLCCHSICYG